MRWRPIRVCYQPDIVVLNAGYAHVIGFGRLSLGKKICLTCISCRRRRKSWRPMEAINHCLLTSLPRAARAC